MRIDSPLGLPYDYANDSSVRALACVSSSVTRRELTRQRSAMFCSYLPHKDQEYQSHGS